MNFFDVINSIESIMNKTEYFIVNADLYNFAVSIKSPLRYVHRPALRYEFKMVSRGNISIGQMSAVLRLHDIETLHCFSDFTDLWIAIETKYPSRKQGEKIIYATDIGYFSRKMYFTEDMRYRFSSQAVGAAVSDYIYVFDELFKYYLHHTDISGYEIEKIYVEKIKTGKLLI